MKKALIVGALLILVFLGIVFIIGYLNMPKEEVIHSGDWPPEVRAERQAYACTEAGSETDRAGKTSQRVIGDKVACVTKIVSVVDDKKYILYAYAFPGSRSSVQEVIYFTFSEERDASDPATDYPDQKVVEYAKSIQAAI